MDIFFNSLIIFLFHNSLDLIEAAYDRTVCPAKVRSSRHYVATNNKTCYLFVDIEKYWDEARTYCWKMGGELLYVQDQQTMDFIKLVLNSRELRWSNNGVWNGASDLRGKGWEWTTGKSLTYTNWSPGEPSKMLGFISIENCACMRRSDSWRWHDYHCHLNGYEYKFICQFPMVEKKTYTGEHVNTGAPLEVERDDRVAMIGLVVAGIALLIIICAIVYALYRKHESQKREHVKRTQRLAARFQNTGYATIMQDISHDRSHDNSNDTSVNQSAARPVSNIYLDPVEINRVYDVVNKDTSLERRNFADSNHSEGRNESDISETARLVYSGGASSAGNLAEAGLMSNTPSEAAGATSACCSNSAGRRIEENEYIEMSGGNSMGNIDSLGKEVNPARCAGGSVDNLKNCKGGATGSVHDLKSSNMYVTPVHYDSKLNNSVPVEKSKSPEIHIYSNRLDEIDNNSSLGLRPLPPVPNTDSTIPVEKRVS
ncbi:uncharacterized protein LOC123563589 [Mercenaria mercenaria]|uniref:uncharacterized protein LOC123563589 n=1 Tax=Mercenaria mercenaria TaxID=6596 RepID=UPI00234F07A4|nr:uncharacterized protein LOC123563589 [Mercenaria mercenaria]